MNFAPMTPGTHTMELDDELCLCFNVSKRKVLNFLRIERPERAGQLAECFGAGTGCGWCRPYLEQLFSETVQHHCAPSSLPSSREYRQLRAKFLETGDDANGLDEDDR